MSTITQRQKIDEHLTRPEKDRKEKGVTGNRHGLSFGGE